MSILWRREVALPTRSFSRFDDTTRRGLSWQDSPRCRPDEGDFRGLRGAYPVARDRPQGALHHQPRGNSRAGDALVLSCVVVCAIKCCWLMAGGV